MFSCIRFVSLFVMASSSVALGEVPQPMSALPGRQAIAPQILPPQSEGITKPIETRSEPQVRKDPGDIIDGSIVTLGLDDCDTPIRPNNDCNQNGVADECEIDCNVNDIADACEIVTDPSLDCDSNGVIDACGLTSLDMLSDPFLQDNTYGWSFDVQHDLLVVSARVSKVVYVYRKIDTTWGYESTLLPSIDGERDFGLEVAIFDGEIAVISNVGISFYHFTESTWQLKDYISVFNLKNFKFGKDLIVARTQNFRDLPHVWRRINGVWNDTEYIGIENKLAVDIRALGRALAIHGDNIVSSAVDRGINPRGGSGLVYTFEHVTHSWNGTIYDYWIPIESTTISAPNNVAAGFGSTISVYGDTLVLGSPSESNGRDQSQGAVYIYVWTGSKWFLQHRLTANISDPFYSFGKDVTIDGSNLAIKVTDGFRIYQFDGQSWKFTVTVKHDALPAIDGVNYLVYTPGDSTGQPPSVLPYILPLNDCDGMGNPDVCVLENEQAIDCDGNTVPDACEVDCNINGVSDKCDLMAGDSIDCQGNGIPDECEVAFNDCNKNGIPDDCEGDCNGNGVPDPCEILAGDAFDCNYSGVLDECETEPVQLGILRSIEELAAPTYRPFPWYASSIDISGDRVILGSPAEGQFDGAGVVYIYAEERGHWNQEAILSEPDPAWINNFGRNVAIDGDLAVVSIGQVPRVYVYRRTDSGWVQDFLFTNSDGLKAYTGDIFIEGERVFIASGEEVLVFHYDGENWGREASLLPQGNPDFLGDVCSISGDQGTVAIGYCRADVAEDDSDNSGAVAIFERDGNQWEEVIKFSAPAARRSAYFGTDLSIHGDWLSVVEAKDSFSGITNSWSDSSVYIYQRIDSEWVLNLQLPALGETTNKIHAKSVAMQNDVLLIGKFKETTGFFRTGEVDLYRLIVDEWVYEQTFTGDEVQKNSVYGLVLAMDQGRAIVNFGWYLNWYYEGDAKAYIFNVPFSDCNGNKIPDDCDIELGISADCNNNNYPDDCDIDTPFLDCNQNGQFDTCEMDADSSLDCDASMRLDECENVPYTVGAFADSDPRDSKFGVGLAQAKDILVIGDSDTWLTHVYRKQNGEWLLEQKIDCESNTDNCGRAVATDGHTIAVNGVSKGRITGFYGSSMVHLYRHDGASWNLDGTLVPSDRSDNDGESTSYYDYLLGDDNISIEGNTVAVGLARKNGRDGAVYIQQRIADQWQETQILHPDTDDIGAEFGVSVRLSGEWLFVGAHHSNGYRGSVYIYKFDGSTWNMVDRLYSEFTDYDYIRFGESLSVDGNRLAVVSPEERSAVGGTGVIYLYCLDNGHWIQCDKISSQDDFIYLADGTHISLKGDYLVVGCPDCNYSSGGFAYLFKYDGDSWVELPYYDGDSNSLNVYRLGTRVAIDDDTALVAAPYALNYYYNGRPPSVMAIAFPFIDCNLNSSPDECDIESGLSMDCNANRKPDECDLDDDGDLIPNDCDQCLASDISSTIIINGCDTGVPNELDSFGCSMADAFESCPQHQLGSDATVDCVVAIANQWIKDGRLEQLSLSAFRKCGMRIPLQQAERDQVSRSVGKRVR